MVMDSSIFIEHLRAKDKSQTTLANLSLDSTPYVTAVTWYELYMGATALVHNLPLKTLNIRHFNKIPNLIII